MSSEMKRKSCIAAILVLAAVGALTWHMATRAGRPPNILLITVETLRRDHCSLYGYDRDTTPFLRELAAESIVFDNGWSHSSWTYPSMACVLSGRMPQETGVWHEGSEPGAGLLLWLTALRDRGYRAGAVTSNRFVGRLTAAAPDCWDRREAYHDPRADELVARALAFTRSGSGEPWFVACHLFDPHSPYDPPSATSAHWLVPAAPRLPADNLGPKTIKPLRPISGDERRHIVARHDAEIRYLDRELRLLVDSLRWDDQWDNTCLILTADHGERFGDEGWGHGGKPTDAVTAVPFLVRLPGGRLGGTRTDALVGGIDVLPTLLTQAGVPVPEDLPGVNAVSLLNDPRPGRVLEQHVVGIDWQDEGKTTYALRNRHRGRLCGTTHSIEEVPVTPADAAPQAGDESVLADLRDLGYL
ncbi:MAG: sulfatase [Candidatus Brocadiia bacterium]